MLYILYIIAILVVIASFLPAIPNNHYIFRAMEFGRLQMVVVIPVLVISLFLISNTGLFFWGVQIALASAFVYHLTAVWPYFGMSSRTLNTDPDQNTGYLSILSANVLQFNTRYDDFIKLVQENDPDVIFTVESDSKWERAMAVFEESHPHFLKIPLENTYGMHFYSRISCISMEVKYRVSDDLPSIRALLNIDGERQILFHGVHPPPPSPTEEETSAERDGELMHLAREIQKEDFPTIVVGDFNNVPWARSSVLFRKTSGLKDGRMGKGFISTFHADYPLFRFPIDLFFHSHHIQTKSIKTLSYFGSDHFPLWIEVVLKNHNLQQNASNQKLDPSEKEEVDEMIREGKEEDGDRDSKRE